MSYPKRKSNERAKRWWFRNLRRVPRYVKRKEWLRKFHEKHGHNVELVGFEVHPR